MLKHFLIVLDTVRLADDVLAHVVGVVRAAQGRITLLHLLDQSAGRNRFVDPVDWHIQKLEVETGLNEMAQKLRKSGVPVQTATLEDRDPEHMLQFAKTHDVDLLILTGQTEGGGDLFHNLMKRTRIPVLVLRADVIIGETSTCYQKILVPLDGSQRAECTLPLVTALAQNCSAEIVLAHVVHKPEMPRRAAPTAEDAELVKRLVKSNRGEAMHYLEQTALRLPGKVETKLLINESVAAALHTLAEEIGIDLIVLSAHGHSGMPQWPYGSVTNSLIAYSRTPLLIVQDLPLAAAASATAPTGRTR